MESEEQIWKKEHTGCEHGKELHSEGLCWKITNIELRDEPTNKKYCPCTNDKNLIRTYARLGYTEIEQHDQLVTKKCVICGVEVLFNVDNDVCNSCRTSALYNPI
jgi:hypothetical protein